MNECFHICHWLFPGFGSNVISVPVIDVGKLAVFSLLAISPLYRISAFDMLVFDNILCSQQYVHLRKVRSKKLAAVCKLKP